LESEQITGEIVDYYICGDDDNPNEKMYVRQMWEPDPNREISIKQRDMFINKAQCMKVLRDYCV